MIKNRLFSVTFRSKICKHERVEVKKFVTLQTVM